MIKKSIVFGLIILMFGLSGCKSASEPEQKPEQEIEKPVWPPATESENTWVWPAEETTGEKLHQFWSFPLGVAVPGANTSNASNNNALDTENPQYQFLKHFNVVVAENEMKPANMMPSSESGAYGRKTNADKLVSYAKATDKRIRGHVLIWHSQTPSWFFPSTSYGNGAKRKEKLYENMEKHIKAVFEHFGGAIDSWDVCNEVVDQDDRTNGGARKDSSYTKIMEAAGLTGINRYEYVVKAFEWARKYADANGGQNVKLFLTDFGIERAFPDDVAAGRKSKIDMFEGLVDYLIANNAPFDGVGFQGHFRLYDHPVEQISDGIDRFAAKEIKPGKKIIIQVCELDFSVFSNAKGEGSATTIATENLDERLSDLADNYRDFFDMFEEKYNQGKLDMVLIWGIDDGHSWLNSHPVSGRTDYPLLFDRSYNPKEAYSKLKEGRTPKP
jgi:endo-1,4-beta-xylanase